MLGTAFAQLLLYAGVTLWMAPAPPDAQAPLELEPDTELLARSLSKKERYLESKKPPSPRARPTRVGRRAHRPVWARNLRTNEVAALDGPGRLRDDSARADFFKCWFTLKAGPIPSALVEVLLTTATHFETREIKIVSGFRHPKYNLLLRKKGREVASKSQHTQANAIDFFLPEVNVRQVYDYLLETHAGGVGFYPVSEFVHVDFGRKRSWRGT